jgi:hypothetical protein
MGRVSHPPAQRFYALFGQSQSITGRFRLRRAVPLMVEAQLKLRQPRDPSTVARSYWPSIPFVAFKDAALLPRAVAPPCSSGILLPMPLLRAE